MGSSYGQVFKVTTYGESHGGAVGVVIDGCPARLPLGRELIQAQLDRRRPGTSRLVSPRQEADQVEILSGWQDGLTLGTPLSLLVRNQDARSHDYDELRSVYRPSHADYTYDAKYGLRAVSGGGRASARETIGRVAAGAVARQLLAHRWGVELVAWVTRIGEVTVDLDPATVAAEHVESLPDGAPNHVRCPDPAAAAAMVAAIEAARRDGDSIGGWVVGVARGVPAGWGEPVFDKLEAELAKAMLSLPACKGFEIGSGFAGATQRGSAHNDPFYHDGQRIRTRTNRSGGVQGGISNGEPIHFRLAFKPTATIRQPQETVTVTGESTVLAARGRHDPCVVPRAVPIVEAMTALVLADLALRQAARLGGGGGA
ncbi:MAG: chorismate synthase [Fimbriimonadaceae bacterium]|nr:chorismate synthase [Fimbriimonadaceae bacterium]